MGKSVPMQDRTDTSSEIIERAYESLDAMGRTPWETKQTSIQEPDEPNWLVVFFSDRPLAKIWGILLFLGALFFLSLIWWAVGAVGKILIGLLFGFSLYGIWVWMDRKWHTTESRTLLGVGIAINTLTILSGRWIIGGESESSPALWDTITLIFLLFNTAFAVVTALVYASRTFLIFSFIFAYLIPFLTGSESSSIFLILAYNAIISTWGYLLSLMLSYRETSREDVLWLFRTVLIGSLVLLVITSFGIRDTGDLISYMVILFILTGVWVWVDTKIEKSLSISAIIVSGYTALIFAMIGVGALDGSLFIYIVAIVPLMVLTLSHTILFGVSRLLSGILFFPLILGLFLLSLFWVSSVVSILIPLVLLYGVASFFILGSLSRWFQYLFFILLGSFMSICSFALDTRPIDIALYDRLVLAIVSITFFCFSLWNAFRLKLDHLVLLSAVITAILLWVLLSPLWSLSWIFYSLFLLIAFTVPFIMKRFTDWLPSVSIIAYQVLVNLFMILELISLGRAMWFSDSSNSLVTLWVIVFALSIASSLYSFLLVRSRSGSSISSLSELPEWQKNLIYGIFAIPISLFSLAVAIVFSGSPSIVAAVWILESSIFAFMYGKMRNTPLLLASLVLLIIGLIRLVPFFDTIHAGDWILLVPLAVIAASLFVWVRALTPRSHALTGLYDILHILGILAVGSALIEIIPHSPFGWSILGGSIFVLIATFLYRKVDGPILSTWLAVLICGFFFYHFGRMDGLRKDLLPVLIQLIGLAIVYFSSYVFMRHHEYGRWTFFFASVLTIIITSLYVNDITQTVFAVTIYLTLLSAGLILRWIGQNKTYFRTAWLYIGVVVLMKILFYDLWFGLDNAIIRVVALMISGGVMIALSQLYGKSVSRGWTEEFSLENFSGGTSKNSEKTESSKQWSWEDRESNPFTSELADSLKEVDISDVALVRLLDQSGRVVFESKRAGILRITSFIVEKLGKKIFSGGELDWVLQNVLPHIRSALPKTQLDAILSTIETWIKWGGSIEFISKE